MASRVELIGCLMVVVATLLLGGATAETRTVRGDLGWTVPGTGDIEYKVWAASQDFEIGDILLFKWNGTHNVAEVSQAHYDNCTTTNTIGAIQTTSPVNITLDSNVTRYFICTVGEHCSRGQKVKIEFRSSSAASLTITALSVLLVAIAISFLTYN